MVINFFKKIHRKLLASVSSKRVIRKHEPQDQLKPIVRTSGYGGGGYSQSNQDSPDSSKSHSEESKS